MTTDGPDTREMRHPWDRPLGVWNLAVSNPDHPAILAAPSGRTFTMAGLVGSAHQLVHAVRARGVRDGDVVIYALPNDVDIVVWQLAAQESGIQTIALNPALSGSEIATIVEHSGAVGIVLHHDHSDRAAEILAGSDIAVRVSVGGDIPGFESVDHLVCGHPTTEPADRRVGLPISYSSGTTGQPKAISRQRIDLDPTEFANGMKLFAHAFRFQPLQGAHMVTAGMHHGGCQSFYQGALHAGQPLVIMGKFDAEATLAAIEQHRVTTAYMVPTQFVRLLRLPEEVRARYDVSSLEVVVHSAAPCPREVKQQMMDWWGPVIWETYGGMEGAAAIAKPHHWLEHPGTVGRAVKGMAIKILDDDDRELPAGEIGRVFLESDTPTFEYRGDPELTASVHVGRAFTLGDIGYLDDDGFLFLCDRAKDMIISGGVNIYPAEVEGVLATHPGVGDVAVIGVPDPEWGEQVKAIVEPVAGVEPSDALAQDLIDFCLERLAKFKCPRSVDFRAELPRTDQGKLYKRHLRDEYWADADRKV
ncbi:MAG: putative acyl-CoA ligase [Acidimicrobiia bacterium]